jgi:hypothetical protein
MMKIWSFSRHDVSVVPTIGNRILVHHNIKRSIGVGLAVINVGFGNMKDL